LVGASIALGWLTPQERLPDDFRLGPLWFVIPTYPLVAAGVGTLIASRRPGTSIGWLLCAAALIYAVDELGLFYSYFCLARGASGPVTVEWVAWVARWISLPWMAVQLIFLPVLFPSGKAPSQTYRWLLWSAAVTALVGAAARALSPALLADLKLVNPVAIADPTGALQRVADTAELVLMVIVLTSLASVFFRLRDSSGERRQQLKWFGSAIAVLVAVTTAAKVADDVVEANSPFLEIVVPTIYVTIPIGIGFSILRYRLYDIDLVINRTLVYGMLAATISALYLTVVVGVGAIVGMHDHVSLLPLLAAGMIALAFEPLRRRLQRLADRLVNGRRATPYDALAALSRRLTDSTPGEQVLTDTVRAVCEATGARSASLWLRGGAEWRVMAQWPAGVKHETPSLDHLPPPSVRAFPVHSQGAVLGTLAVSAPPGRPLSTGDERLLGDVASQAGLLFRNLGLTADLVSRLGELQESRRRLVTAQEEERRRIERNLHDGAQQDLFGLKISIREVQALSRHNPSGVHAALERLEEDADRALLTVKELARGVYPSLLTTQGLAGAVRARARAAPVDVRFSSTGLRRYRAEIEEAVYFACAEALQNAIKHAHPTSVRISLVEKNDELTLEVEDDGQGFDMTATPWGAGLHSIRDRIDVIGGTIEAITRPGVGTTVKGRVPLL
jgi:signal transduction histidine kinase